MSETERVKTSVVEQWLDQGEAMCEEISDAVLRDLLDARRERDAALGQIERLKVDVSEQAEEFSREWERSGRMMRERDEAIAGMNSNAEALANAAKMCREARHVSDLAIALLRTFKGRPEWDGISHLLRALTGRYSWLITGRLDYQVGDGD